MRHPISTARFRKEARLAVKTGKDLSKLDAAIRLLLRGEPLPSRLRDHQLAGEMKGYRECHLEPDWLLVYRLSPDGQHLELARIGTHSDLFG